jgi:hypothetical protein
VGLMNITTLHYSYNQTADNCTKRRRKKINKNKIKKQMKNHSTALAVGPDMAMAG